MMFRKYVPHIALAGCLFLASATVTAGPIAFTSSDYAVFASAELGSDTSGLLSQTHPREAFPLGVVATLADSSHSGVASGMANGGLLDASTDAISVDRFAVATAGAGFSGEFLGTGERINFLIDFSNNNELFGGSADAALFVTLVSGGVTLLNEILNTTQMVEQSFILNTGSINLFDIQLISNAEAQGDGVDIAFGTNTAHAAFSMNAAPVPEPGMGWLMLSGLGLLGWVRHKRFLLPLGTGSGFRCDETAAQILHRGRRHA